MKRWAFRIAGVGVGITLALSCGFGLLFAFYDEVSPPVQVYCLERCGEYSEWAACTVWSAPANATVRYVKFGAFDSTITYNANGMRGDVVPYDKPEGVRRVLVIGDSYMEAQATADSDLFQTRLNVMLDDHTEVISMGASGWTVANEYLWYQCEGYRYHADVVINHFFLNDIWMLSPSVFEAGNGIFSTLDWDTSNGIIPMRVKPVTEGHSSMELIRGLSSPELDEAWKRFGYVLRLWQHAVTQNGAELFFLYSPGWWELDGDRQVYPRVMGIVEHLGMPTIDVWPAFQAHRQALFIRGDWHYTVEGHAVLADVLYEWLTR